MTRISFAEFCKDPAKYMDEAATAGLVVERNAGPVVIISEEEFEGWQETLYLLRSPANATRLLSAIAEADAGKLQEHGLIDE